MTRLRSSMRTWMQAAGFSLALVLVGSQARAAPIDEAEKLEVRIPAGDIVLDATLYRPKGAKKDIPGVVLGHGSGSYPRKFNSFWVDTALKTGAAVLSYDKRGTGKSTGNYIEWDTKDTAAMFQRLAVDMNHAVRWLAKQPGVDRNRVGLVGGSQAGWVLPLAASQEPLVKFVVIGEGVPLPAGIEIAHSTYLDLVSKEGEGNPAPRHVAAADILSFEAVGSEDEPLGYDPSPVLENLKTPVLWIFGLYDGVIPARASIDRIGRLQKAGKTNHDIHIFPFGDHNFQNVFTKGSYDVGDVSRQWLTKIGLFDPEYLEALKNGTSDEHARIAWNVQIVEARSHPPQLSPATLRQLRGRYEGDRSVLERNGKLFYRRADGLERELIPLGDDLFALVEHASPDRLRFNRVNGKVSGFTFVTIAGAGENVAREGA